MMRPAALLSVVLVAAGASSLPLFAETTQRTAPQVAYASSCSALNGLLVRRLLVTDALRFYQGEYKAPAAVSRGAAPEVFDDLPEFCRLIASPAKTTAALTAMEVWLPTRAWNGRLVAFGPEVTSPRADYAAMALAVRRGDGVASINAAESRSAATSIAAREVLLAAGDLVRGYFGVGPRNVYWSGCGENAWLGLQTAQQFPADVDAVVAVALRASAVASAADLNLSAFFDRGGKVLIHQRDSADTVYKRLAAEPGATSSALRMFVAEAEIPCESRVLDLLLDTLTRWVEQRTAPDQIVLPAASSPSSMPLCAYPRVPLPAGRAADGHPRYVCKEMR